jgi:hypothetical protein
MVREMLMWVGGIGVRWVGGIGVRWGEVGGNVEGLGLAIMFF